MKSVPFAVQLSLIVFLILIIPFIILMSYTGFTTLRYSEVEIARSSLEHIELNRRFTENFMNNISGQVHRFAVYHDFYLYEGLQKYSAIQGNVDNGLRIQRLQRELVSIARTDEAIHSVFFFFDDGDYVISTDRGIVELADYPSLSWMRVISARNGGLGGFWAPRELQSSTVREMLRGQDSGYFTRVISYVYPLSRLTTGIMGTVVVNVRESSVANRLNPGGDRDEPLGIIILQKDGKIISHPVESNFLIQGRNLPHIAEILDSEENAGFRFLSESDGQYLYTWLKTGYFEWVYVSVQSMEVLLSRTARTIRNMIFLSLAVLLFGTMASMAVFFWVSKPMRLLVNGVRVSAGIEEPALRNEMDILSSAFTRIGHKEKELQDLLNEREKDAVLLAIRNLLSDDPLTLQETGILEQVFPHKYFRVAIAALDNYEEYRRRTTTEQRAYHRFLFISGAEKSAVSPLILRGVHLFEAQIALVINVNEKIETAKLLSFLKTLQETAKPVFVTTLTIGLSDTCYAMNGVYQSVAQASEAVTMRMLSGSNSIIPWTYNEGRKRFFYPQNSEVKILNYLNAGNFAQISIELESIMKAIRSTEGISCDNIFFIYNQLAGGTIRRLSEMNVNTSGFFISHGNIYKSIASSETLEQLSRYMGEFYEELINYLRKDQEEEQAINRIMACFKKYYRKDMFFEDMAAELGISYSYMRKIVKEKTGKSVIDTINLIRIQEAKNLLMDEKLKCEDIAKMVGYRNIQSLKRYFKKFEGLNPLEYRIVSRAAQIEKV
jgi:YesN/AraC family two-component response regulator